MRRLASLHAPARRFFATELSAPPRQLSDCFMTDGSMVPSVGPHDNRDGPDAPAGEITHAGTVETPTPPSSAVIWREARPPRRRIEAGSGWTAPGYFVMVPRRATRFVTRANEHRMARYSLSRTQRDISPSRHLSRHQKDVVILLVVLILSYLAFQLGYNQGRKDERDGVSPTKPLPTWWWR